MAAFLLTHTLTLQAHGNVHPMLRYIADAAPQKGEKAMRSGEQGAAAEEAPGQEAAFKAASARLMGDAATAGDAPFGGEVQVDSQVSIACSHCSCSPDRQTGCMYVIHCSQRWQGLGTSLKSCRTYNC